MRLSRERWLALGIALPLSLLAAACSTGWSGLSGSPASSGIGPSPGPDGLKVVTTTTVFADIVQNVGGSRVAASSIVPPGVGPEDYEPKPDDAKKLADAKLIVSNGVGLDDFLEKLLASGSGGNTPRIV